MQQALSRCTTFRLLGMTLRSFRGRPQSVIVEEASSKTIGFYNFEVHPSLAFIILKGFLTGDLKVGQAGLLVL